MNEPVVGVAVQALRREWVAGDMRLVRSRGENTDDRGRYRIGGLLPGDYVIGVPSTQSTLTAVTVPTSLDLRSDSRESTDPAAWTPATRRIQSVRPANDGAFSIKGLPAGEYFLPALTDVEPGEWLSPAFLDQITGAAVRVRVIDGGKTVQSLRIAR